MSVLGYNWVVSGSELPLVLALPAAVSQATVTNVVVTRPSL